MTHWATYQTGLNDTVVVKQRQQYGRNYFAKQKKQKLILVFLHAFISPLSLLLLLIALLALLSNLLVKQNSELLIEFYVIIGIIIVNSAIETYQIYQTRKKMQELSDLVNPNCLVKRNGKEQTIPTQDLVVGDVVMFEAGQVVPADIIVYEAHDLKINEAVLTGENTTVAKIASLKQNSWQTAQVETKVYLGTNIVNGRGWGIVARVGQASEMGQIAKATKNIKITKTPLQKKLHRLTFTIAWMAGLMAVVILLALLLLNIHHDNLSAVSQSLIISMTLALAVMPESLPVIISLILAIGAKKMATESAIVKTLHAVETLGGVSVICTDKTGTLTENKMQVESFYVGLNQHKNQQPLTKWDHLFLKAIVLCNDAYYDQNNEPQGDPTETALLDFAQKYNVLQDNLRKIYLRVKEIPFNSTTKIMHTTYQKEKSKNTFVKGAYEAVISTCSHFISNNNVTALHTDKKQEMINLMTKLAEKQRRVLAVAYGKGTKADILLGFIVLVDPIKTNAVKTINWCQSANIQVKMITGDHAKTAYAYGEELGLCHEFKEVITSNELALWKEDEWKNKITNYNIFARITPEDKLKIVAALQDNNEVVAMCGDGVNDAPSLLQSDVGVAMGNTGTAVAQDAAELILLDDNFSTIQVGVNKGRALYEKIKTALAFTLASNLTQVMLVFLIILATKQSPLNAINVLWFNLVIDSALAIALGAGADYKMTQSSKPRPPSESIFQNLKSVIVLLSLVVSVVLLIFYFIIRATTSTTAANNLLFASLIMIPLVSSWAIVYLRTKTSSQNYVLLTCCVIVGFLNICILFVPHLNSVFLSQQFTWNGLEFAWWIMMIVVTTIIMWFSMLMYHLLINHPRVQTWSRKIALTWKKKNKQNCNIN